MTLRIERSERGGLTVFAVSGHLEAEYIDELRRLFGPSRNFTRIILDLSELRLADRECIRFLCSSEARGITLENCPHYIREWIQKEAGTLALDGRDDAEEDGQI
jgi:hypothetical protein